MMGGLSKRLVVNELLKFYRSYDLNESFQRRLIECWGEESKNPGNMWCDAYKEVLKQCR